MSLPFFENFKDNTACLREVGMEFLELTVSDDTITVTEDNYDTIMENGKMYIAYPEDNSLNEELLEHLLEQQNKNDKAAVEEYNKQVAAYNEEHANDEDFVERHTIEFQEATLEDIQYDLDKTFATVNDEGCFIYVPKSMLYHKNNKEKHSKIGIDLVDYVINEGFDLEDAIEMVML